MKTLKTHLGEENIETKLVDCMDRIVPYAVIVRDLDCGELVTRVNCPSLEVAERYYDKYAFGKEVD